MSAKQFSTADAEKAKITIVQGDKGSQAVHDLVTAYRANRRSGSANTKTRAEVRGSGKKIYRQKGTGGARHGDRGAPIFVGGGVAFGPKPRDYSKKVPKSVRKLAFRRVLGSIIEQEKAYTISDFSISDGKTKSFIETVKGFVDVKKTLIIGENFDESTRRAGRNVQNVLLMSAAEANIEQILHANAVLITEGALETIAKRSS